MWFFWNMRLRSHSSDVIFTYKSVKLNHFRYSKLQKNKFREKFASHKPFGICLYFNCEIVAKLVTYFLFVLEQATFVCIVERR